MSFIANKNFLEWDGGEGSDFFKDEDAASVESDDTCIYDQKVTVSRWLLESQRADEMLRADRHHRLNAQFSIACNDGQYRPIWSNKESY